MKKIVMRDVDVVSTFADVGGLIKEFDYKLDTNLMGVFCEFVKWYSIFRAIK